MERKVEVILWGVKEIEGGIGERPRAGSVSLKCGCTEQGPDGVFDNVAGARNQRCEL